MLGNRMLRYMYSCPMLSCLTLPPSKSGASVNISTKHESEVMTAKQYLFDAIKEFSLLVIVSLTSYSCLPLNDSLK